MTDETTHISNEIEITPVTSFPSPSLLCWFLTASTMTEEGRRGSRGAVALVAAVEEPGQAGLGAPVAAASHSFLRRFMCIVCQVHLSKLV